MPPEQGMSPVKLLQRRAHCAQLEGVGRYPKSQMSLSLTTSFIKCLVVISEETRAMRTGKGVKERTEIMTQL
jgi:hypothetical protein